MYEPQVATDDSERTAFRRAEKKYKLYYDQNPKSSKKGCVCAVSDVAFAYRKKQSRPIDLSEVIDFKVIQDSFNRNSEIPPGVIVLRWDFDRPVFCLENCPGRNSKPQIFL
ncbi:hypothetical protein RHSIM_Rhsim12G0100100 [Rhododendron simsii]|uniref:Uncharacterized protein n=1 Tax=Rhododendron simsii TaxID=118357 RepID=A0A834G4V3_RHOSS|nr:hypothetical protein RHSIM_Rhsim12G0100100 [Rhododendron simsii]